MILSGPQYMNLGMFSWVLTAIVPCSQYNLRQYRIILSADTASEVRQMLSQKRR